MRFLIALCTVALAYAANPACRLKPETGLCRGYFPRYYYDPEDGTCKTFIYGGCGGNNNSFDTEEECLEKCKGTEPEAQYSPDPVAICHLKPERGMCLGYFPRYYYNAETRKCEKFIYGGCQGNPNNFNTLEECEQRCVKPEEQFSEVPICEQPVKPGNCLAYMPRFYYDKEEGKCKEFIYGGCGGNDNNFLTLEACEQECGVTYSQSTCQQEKETGPCRGYFPRYYYDSKDGICKKFVYGGCQGNDNNFETQEECELTCASSAPVDCTSEPETGLCRGYFPRYYYDQTTETCKEFVYGGCGGNDNNYKTQEECLRTCACEYLIKIT